MPSTPRLDRGWLRLALPLTAAIVLAACVAGTMQHGLWGADEPREAGIGAEMLRAGFSPVPTLGGEPFLEKPPLHPWLLALSFRVLGITEGAARLPAVVASLGSALAAGSLARHAGGRWAGALAALALVSMREFSGTSHKAVNDALLICFVAAGHLAVLRGRSQLRAGRPPNGFLWIAPCTGLAFLTKSFIGPVLIAGPALLALALDGDRRVLRRGAWRIAAWSCVGVLVVGLPWVIALVREIGPDAARAALVDNSIGRGLGAEAGGVSFHVHEKPPWFYLGAFPRSLLPWTLALPALALSPAVRGRLRDGRTRFLAVLVLAGLLLLSIPAGKREVYAAPLLPAAAAVVGVWLSRTATTSAGRADRGTLTALLGLGAVAGIGGGAGLLWFAAGGDVSVLGLGSVGTGWRVVFGLAGLIGLGLGTDLALTVMGVRRPRPALRAWRITAFVALVTIGLHAIARPLKDQLLDPRAATEQLVASVPPGARLVGLSASERLRGAVSFYTGRQLRRVEGRRPLRAELETGAATHVVIGDEDGNRLGPWFTEHLRRIADVPFPDERRARVYRYEP